MEFSTRQINVRGCEGQFVFSADDRLLSWNEWDNTSIQVLRLADSSVIYDLDHDQGGTLFAHHRLPVVGSCSERRLRVWSLDDGAMIFESDHSLAPTVGVFGCVKFSLLGPHIVAGTENRFSRIDYTTSAYEFFEVPQLANSTLLMIRETIDDYIAFSECEAEGCFCVTDIKDGRRLFEVPLHPSDVVHVVGMGTCAIIFRQKTCTGEIWDLFRRRLRSTVRLPGFWHGIYCSLGLNAIIQVEESSSKRFGVSGTDMMTGECLWTLDEKLYPHFAWSDACETLAIQELEEVVFYNPTFNRIFATARGHSPWPEVFQFSPSGKHLISLNSRDANPNDGENAGVIAVTELAINPSFSGQ